MSLYDEHPLSEFDRKALDVCGERVVIKSLASNSALARLPRFVSEYLIAKYVKPDSWRADLANIQSKIRDLLPEHEARELLKNKLLTRGEVTLIDNVEARVELGKGLRLARVPALADNGVRVPAALTEEHPGLLLGGLWGTAKVRYAPEEDNVHPNELIHFIPFQVGPPNVDEFKAFRKRFTSDEWMGLVLQSAGYAAGAFPDRRTRMLLLARLLPLVERNVNLIELGPRQTGKTFLLRNLSPRVFTISGGKTTPANLFANLNTRQVGILGSRKVVVFDEIAHTVFDEDETISTLKDYMESGHFSRGRMSFSADAGLMFAGNLDVEGTQPHSKYRHLLEPLPRALIDTALQDRMHGYIPGWEMPKVSPSSLATGVGFLTDYFGEVLVQLRNDSHDDLARSVPMQPGMTQRDQRSVERLTSGFIKLLYPDGMPSGEELDEVVTLACELRQRVHNQLCTIAPGEFRTRLIAPASLSAHAAPDLQFRETRSTAFQDRGRTEAVVGATTGLGVMMDAKGTSHGGNLILIQVSAINGSPGLVVTGKHGIELKHSIQAVYNLVRSRFREFGIAESRLKTQTVAVHLVQISTHRDGPSAGLAFAVGIVSALANKSVPAAFAFSGEVSLHGEVGPVGGIPEKLAAAAKGGRKHVVIPLANLADLSGVPGEILDLIEIHPVNSVAEALALAFPNNESA